MDSHSRPPTSEEYREILEAKLRLAKMKLHEPFAQKWEQMKPQSLRDEFAERYRELIGVHPEERNQFKDAMEIVKENGGMSVEDVIYLINRRRQIRESASDDI